MAMRKRNSKRFKIFKYFLYASMFVTSMYIFGEGAKIFKTTGGFWRQPFLGDIMLLTKTVSP